MDRVGYGFMLSCCCSRTEERRSKAESLRGSGRGARHNSQSTFNSTCRPHPTPTLPFLTMVLRPTQAGTTRGNLGHAAHTTTARPAAACHTARPPTYCP